MGSKQSILSVKMLGCFELARGEQVLKMETLHSKMQMKLLAYLLCHRNQVNSVMDLCEALWGETESHNPVGALKNLIYRLRNTLCDSLGVEDYVLSGRGFYQWNPSIFVQLDMEQMETFQRLGKQSSNTKEIQLEQYQRSLQLYKGYFLKNLSSEHWTIPCSTYYHSLYLTTLQEVSRQLLEEKEYAKVEMLCTQALDIDELEENIHLYLMKSLYLQGKKELAIRHYEKTNQLFCQELGSNLLPPFQQLFEGLQQEVDTSIVELRNMLEQHLKDGETAIFSIQRKKQQWTFHVVTNV
ncbi:MAG: BTAD domain-containing putative transcriptional regulator [Lachnospiraceae bacterium]